jgi:tetratricopeptide (TPR) repeat protein
MSELRFEDYIIPAATLGPDNPLPQLDARPDVHGEIPLDPSVPEEEGRHVGFGGRSTCLPYRLQDRYDRTRRPRAFHAAVLENEHLRAVFLPELGGRLWSLLHKPSGRELLDANPVFQPANLAIRNAWFSGGVEWNIGIIGHSPFTCSPIFAARLHAADNTPVLRMYEWERLRGVPYQIDACLPDGSLVLFVRVRIRNPHPREIPMYWWSNIAVPETPDTRVLVPASSAYHFGYTDSMNSVPIPYHLDTDVSYPANLNRAMDFFFRIPPGRRPWIAALAADGSGLAQTSTARLRGRKLFLWGRGPGVRRWQEFLSVPGQAYIEIQAGLARTQLECLPMPAGAEWAWLEAYGLLRADPAAVHGADWERAWRAADARLDGLISQPALDAEFARTAEYIDRPPEEVVQRGSGWGALELRRQARDSEAPFCGQELPFGDPAGAEQAPWLALLEDGALPYSPPEADPGAWMVQAEWRHKLEAAVREGRGDHWLSRLHLGVMRCDAGEIDGAREAWERSLALQPSAWALRNLAVLEQQAGDAGKAADRWLQAHRLAPEQLQLAVECGQALLAADRPRAWLDLLPALPPEVREYGRVRYLQARALLAVGEIDAVEAMLHSLVVPDMREGEVSLSELWFSLQEQRLARREGVPVDDTLKARVRQEFPPPADIDFRMVTV